MGTLRADLILKTEESAPTAVEALLTFLRALRGSVTGYFQTVILVTDFNAEVRDVTLDIKSMTVPAYAEFILLICCVTIDNLKQVVGKLVKFDLAKHLQHSVSVVLLYQ